MKKIGFIFQTKKGILTRMHTDELEMTWGNVEEIRKMLQKIAGRDGFGNILAEGVKRASDRVGEGSSRVSRLYA
jgi:aldehyde:ferredoxin oxidoreductase